MPLFAPSWYLQAFSCLLFWVFANHEMLWVFECECCSFLWLNLLLYQYGMIETYMDIWNMRVSQLTSKYFGRSSNFYISLLSADYFNDTTFRVVRFCTLVCPIRKHLFIILLLIVGILNQIPVYISNACHTFFDTWLWIVITMYVWVKLSERIIVRVKLNVTLSFFKEIR